ncbi:MAG: sulfite exporter TauE/SafE family protein, partial [Rhodobacterales bacterium]|nr:sulfite exporter TauE/SafE family protein [Rhodobacterales bacterium]
MTDILALNNTDLLLLILICFFAGLIRGFSGFGLSAFVMSLSVTIIPPIELIPICWWMEFIAGVFMIKNGWKESDKGTSIVLWLGAICGLPIGLFVTKILDVQISKFVALALILTLSVILFRNFKLHFLSSKLGTVCSGICAGIATGLASIGGLIVATYVLASQNSARRMRASLVVYILLNSLTTFV